MSTIGVAVIGTGFIGPVHVEGLRRAGLSVVGVLDVPHERAKQAAESLGLAKAYETYEQVLEDQQVQSIHIAVPNRLHYDMAARALKAGKHVMCEKPLAMNSEQSAELVQIARQSGRAAGVNHNLRFYPLCQEVAQRARNGVLGDIYHVAGSYVQDWLFHDTDFNWRVLAEEGGPLRAVADIGTHWLDLVQAITGMKVHAVCADLKTVYPVRQRPTGVVETFSGKPGPAVSTEPVEVTTEDYGCVMLRFRGGARGCLWVSQVTAGRKNCLRLEIAGSRQAVAFDTESPNQLWIGHRDQPNECLLRDPALLSEGARPFANYPGGHNEGFPDTFKQCFRVFYEDIASGEFASSPRFPTFADGHREIVLCDAIVQSHQSQSWVEIQGADV